MKIPSDDSIRTYLQGIKETEKGGAARNVRKSSASRSDSVEISGTAKDYQYVYQRVTSVPDVRSERIAEVQQKIRDDRDYVQSERVADKMIRSLLLEAVL